ncbi:MAG: AhpC/TSA family protein [Chitinophagaceae bacterium]|nr:AhpC/TSA family protein [Chitinophagaceae bacterium]MCB9046606.1 AhpC/TSA family protein [Chitinophagales bacterium]
MKYLFLLAITCLSFPVFAQFAEDAHSISPLLISEEIPAATLLNTDNQPVQIRDIVKQKPSVLIFYRGGWCPYCNAHLAQIAGIEDEIIKAGYQVIAVSPDAPEQLQVTVDKKELKYTLLSDGDGTFCKAMGIAYKSPDHKWKTNQLQKHSGGKNPGFLPVPSVFVVDKNGDILFEYINPDYKHRIDGKLLLAVLNALK